MARRVEIAGWWWAVLAAWLVIAAAAPRVMAQACCRCDIGGNPGSCNTGGIPNQAVCEEICAQLGSTFGSFQNTCPPGTEFAGCTGPGDPGFCDIICAAATPASMSVPATSTGGTLVGLVGLAALGGYKLARRRELPQ